MREAPSESCDMFHEKFEQETINANIPLSNTIRRHIELKNESNTQRSQIHK
jgi:hypothetical protein